MRRREREVRHALRPAVRILVLPKQDDLLPQHAKRLLGTCTRYAFNAMNVRKTTSARLSFGCTNIRVTSPKRWMSAVTVFGGRHIKFDGRCRGGKVRLGALIA